MLHAINWIAAPFQYDFMMHALLAGSLAAILASLVGFFVVIRQLGFAAHALGHVAFAGATGAVLIGLSPMFGQLAVTLVAAMVMGGLGHRMQEKDTVIGITLAFALGMGVLFLHFYRSYSGQANSILWGNLLGISTDALNWMFGLTLIGVLFLALLSRPLWFASLSPSLAEAKSVSIPVISILFFGIMALAITLASQVVGVLLVFTLVVGPSAIALQWTHRFWPGMFVSCLLGVLIVWGAILLSYYTDWPISFWISAEVFLLYILGVVINVKRRA
jgi:zinc/manganese transport system permease protein